MKKTAQIGIPLLVLFVAIPLLALALVVTMTGNAAQRAADCLTQQQAAATRLAGAGSSAGAGSASAGLAGAGLAGGGASGTVRLAQANIKTSLSPARFAADLATTYAAGADLVSLNETAARSRAELTRPGYAVYRDPTASGQARSTAVAWRTDRWRRLAAGRVRIVAGGPQKWDAGRSATWVTLTRTPTGSGPPSGGQSAGGEQEADQDVAGGAGGAVSVVSVHHMINPATYGPDKPRRRQLYRQAMSTLADLAAALGRRGPVFVAGDFNSQRAADDPWGPRRTLDANPTRQAEAQTQAQVEAQTQAQVEARTQAQAGARTQAQAGAQTQAQAGALARDASEPVSGMRDTMHTLGAQPTHDGGGTIDYLFYQPTWAAPTRQQTANLNSDHKLLYADFTLTGPTGTRPSGTGATDTGPTGTGPTGTGPTGSGPVRAGDASSRTSAMSAAAAAERYHLGPVQPQLAALVALLAPRFSIDTVGGYRASATDPNGHPAGLAADFMVAMTAQGRAQGDQLAAYALANAQALGIDYLIWRQQIWSVDRAREGWRGMADRGSATANHEDHVHININPTSTLTTNAELPAGGAPADGTARLGETQTGTEDCVVLAGSAGDTAPIASAGDSAVVLPVPANLGDSDQHNWGGAGSNWNSWHTGTDFSLGCGTPVVAAHTGRVSIETDQDWSGPWLVKVSQGPGRLTTWYAHMRKVLADPGQSVAAGQQIGEVGAEGNVSRPRACHLHFEVHTKNGSIYGPDNTDPSTWLARHVPAAGGPAAGRPDPGID